MFSSRDRKDTDVSKSKADSGKQVPSIISANLRIVGNLVSDGDVQVDGRIEGDVTSRTLTVSEHASIRGEVQAESVRIHGTVHGQIKATNVSMGPTAKVIGDVIHANLVIESGAFVEGHCKRLVVEEPREELRDEPGEIIAEGAVAAA
jgi:cytoskeletal protein CcmA (bactofilin family)